MRRPRRDVPRILDACANRAREAARVLEDIARFLLDDRPLTESLKSLRHEVTAAIVRLERVTGPVVSRRDTPADTGTPLTAPAERDRGSIAEVAVAAAKRLGESLRSLEEFAKLASPTVAARFKQLRYRAYTLQQRVTAALMHLDCHPRNWRLCVIVTESLCEHHGWLDVARAALEGGADCIQLREKDLPDDERLRRARRLVELAESIVAKSRRGWPPHRPAIIINDRPDIALSATADGVHLGRQDLPIPAARSATAGRLLIGASTHSPAEARRAASQRADYCGVGAIFPSTTKARRPAGLTYLRAFLSAHPAMPHLAIGGITPDNVGQVVDAGGRAVAVSSAVCSARKPDAVTRRLLRALS